MTKTRAFRYIWIHTILRLHGMHKVLRNCHCQLIKSFFLKHKNISKKGGILKTSTPPLYCAVVRSMSVQLAAKIALRLVATRSGQR